MSLCSLNDPFLRYKLNLKNLLNAKCLGVAICCKSATNIFEFS